MFKKYYLIICLLLMNSTLIAQDHHQQLNKALEKLYDKFDLPGFSTMIVTKDSVLYRNGFGFANIKKRQAFTSETLINICSISKTFYGYEGE